MFIGLGPVVIRIFFYKKWANPGLFYLFIFGLFKQTSLQLLQQINVKNIHPVYGAGIRPLEYEFPPITTRPWLRPASDHCYKNFCLCKLWLFGFCYELFLMIPVEMDNQSQVIFARRSL